MRALVFLNGELMINAWGHVPELTGPWDYIVCADGGGRYALQVGVQPNLLLGDFDSLPPQMQHTLADVPIRRYQRDKDETDADLAVCEVLRHGASEVVLAAALGGRLDHTLANIGLLRRLHEHGVHSVASDGKQAVWLVSAKNSPFYVHEAQGCIISILPFTPTCTGVTLQGMRWPLTNAPLDLGTTRTISNEIVHHHASVSVSEGQLLVMVTRTHIE